MSHQWTKDSQFPEDPLPTLLLAPTFRPVWSCTAPQCCEESDPWNCSKVESIRNDSSSQSHQIGNPRIKLARVTLPRNEIFDATVASLPRLEYGSVRRRTLTPSAVLARKTCLL